MVAEILIDWICDFMFDSSPEQYELESNNNFLNRFVELIADYRSYESKPVKSSPYVVFDEYICGLKEQRNSTSIRF